MKNYMKSYKGSSVDFLILILPGFNDKLVLQFLGSFREAGVASALVSLHPGLIKSARGVRVRADLSIDQVSENVLPRFVFILENRQTASALLADPRVHRLLARTLAAQGRVVILPETQGLFQASGFSEVMMVPEAVKTRPFVLRELVREWVSWMTE
jgi:hypothetical protein